MMEPSVRLRRHNGANPSFVENAHAHDACTLPLYGHFVREFEYMDEAESE